MQKSQRWEKDEAHWSQLMRLSQQGDHEAYNVLLTDLDGAIEGYIRANFGSIPTLEDCVQECLLAIHAARHTYDQDRLFRPWLFTIVRHKTIDVLRRIRPDEKHATTELPEHLLGSTDMTHLERMLDGKALLQKLKPEQQQAITLTKYAGMTTLEAARAVGINESALKARLRRSLTALAQHWQKDWKEHDTKP